MNFSPTERAVFQLNNAYQYCFLTYYDLTLEPGYIGVWKRDASGYFVCIARIEP